jgi:hypothetical protein
MPTHAYTMAAAKHGALRCSPTRGLRLDCATLALVRIRWLTTGFSRDTHGILTGYRRDRALVRTCRPTTTAPTLPPTAGPSSTPTTAAPTQQCAVPSERPRPLLAPGKAALNLAIARLTAQVHRYSSVCRPTEVFTLAPTALPSSVAPSYGIPASFLRLWADRSLAARRLPLERIV